MTLIRGIVLLLVLLPVYGICNSATESSSLMDASVKSGAPLVAHITVALCDNESQGIEPVDKQLGDGNSPQTNLYWGALYGVKSFFSRRERWTQLEVGKSDNPDILDRAVFTTELRRGHYPAKIYVVADAWRGNKIKNSLSQFLSLSAGNSAEMVSVKENDKPVQIHAGGQAHLQAYVGHNGLMEFTLPDIPSYKAQPGKINSSIVLAGFSDHYFREKLVKTQTHSLLTTNGLMAPEAYTLEAAIVSWFSGNTPDKTHMAAATTYSKYQNARLSWAAALFATSQ